MVLLVSSLLVCAALLLARRPASAFDSQPLDRVSALGLPGTGDTDAADRWTTGGSRTSVLDSSDEDNDGDTIDAVGVMPAVRGEGDRAILIGRAPAPSCCRPSAGYSLRAPPHSSP